MNLKSQTHSSATNRLAYTNVHNTPLTDSIMVFFH